MGSQRTVRAIAVSLVITAVTAAAVLFLGFDRHAAGDGGAQVSYNTVDVRAQMLKNGDLRVTQTFDYRLRPCGTPWRQMFQQYTLSSDRVTNISDISIKDLTTGRVYTQDTTVHSPGGYGDYGWNSECAGRWYIADITRSQTAPEPYDAELDALTPTAVGEPKQTKDVEIGWNIPSTASASSMRFELSMTWHWVSTAYDDVVALEWEPFSALNATPRRARDRHVHLPRRHWRVEFVGVAAYGRGKRDDARRRRVAPVHRDRFARRRIHQRGGHDGTAV